MTVTIAAYTHTCTHACACMHICVLTRAHTCIHAPPHTHTHTHRQPPILSNFLIYWSTLDIYVPRNILCNMQIVQQSCGIMWNMKWRCSTFLCSFRILHYWCHRITFHYLSMLIWHGKLQASYRLSNLLYISTILPLSMILTLYEIPNEDAIRFHVHCTLYSAAVISTCCMFQCLFHILHYWIM